MWSLGDAGLELLELLAHLVRDLDPMSDCPRESASQRMAKALMCKRADKVGGR